MTRVAPYLVFWSWNLVFLAFVTFGVGPFVLPLLWWEIFKDAAPTALGLWTTGLLLVPLCASVAGLTRVVRSSPQKTFGLLFAVEAPLFLMALLRVFLVREMNPAMSAMFFAIGLSALVYAVSLARPPSTVPALGALRLLGHGLSTALAFFLAAWAAFYAIPAAAWLIRQRPDLPGNLVDLFEYGLAGLVTAVVGMLFLGWSATLFAVLPIALPWLHARALRTAIGSLPPPLAGKRALLPATAGALALAALFGFAARQPQREVFSLLEAEAGDDSARAELLDRSELVREGLLNAYLASYRYAGAGGRDRHIEELFIDPVGLGYETAALVQRAYGFFGWALRYDGDSFTADQTKAAELYQAFFDAPIERTERDAIRDAAASSFSSSVREAGLEAIGAERVWLARQELSVEEHGDWAQVELHEVYENETSVQQEVLYYFSLPRTAAITGLWLGDSDDVTKRFPFAVAPRGAAQQVYREQIERRRDPALLEQVGPQQYRLRVFPVPAKDGREKVGRMHLWLTYATVSHDGRWPLPRLAERRNVFWNESTVRALAGAPEPEDWEDGDGWLPPAIPARGPVQMRERAIALATGRVVTATPVDPRSSRVDGPLRLAIVLDTSRSMSRWAKAVATDLSWAREALPGQTVHLYLGSPARGGRGARRLDDLSGFRAEETLWYGSMTWRELLDQFRTLRGETEYDAVAVITDEGSIEGEGDDALDPQLAPRLWLVHAGGSFPKACDDGILDLLSRPGSGAAASLSEAAKRFAGIHATGADLLEYADDYVWRLVPEGGQVVAEQAPPGLQALAARQLVTAMGREAATGALDTLDAVHAVAVRHRIVTPYSSMLVLVDDEQRRRLAELEAQADRFQREATRANATAPGNDLFDVSAVPEPHEWALILLGAAFVLIGWRRGRSPRSV